MAFQILTSLWVSTQSHEDNAECDGKQPRWALMSTGISESSGKLQGEVMTGEAKLGPTGGMFYPFSLKWEQSPSPGILTGWQDDL